MKKIELIEGNLYEDGCGVYEYAYSTGELYCFYEVVFEDELGNYHLADSRTMLTQTEVKYLTALN